ncbi:MAG: hypothetical protein WC629_03005, partial [Candidatus Paceibacterota bacterium]
LTIWHFYSLAEKNIPDTKMRELVTKLIDANVQGEIQEKIKGNAVASIGKADFRQFNSMEELQIQESKLMMFLSKIAKTNTVILGSGADGWTLSTSENFEPVYQNFEVGNDHIAERAGYIINVGIGGYKINEKKFHKPSHVAISPFGLSLDKELLSQMLYLQKNNGKRLYRRILRATELLFQAYYNNTNVSRNSRILLIAAAFETLLDLEEPARKHFKDFVEKYCDIPGEPKYRHYYYAHNKAIRDKNRSIKVLWADSFFQLRNQIIHGDVVPEEMYQFQNGDRHLDISVLFFTLIVKSLINEKHKAQKPFVDFLEWKKRKDGTTGFHYEDRSVSIALARMFREASRKQK